MSVDDGWLRGFEPPPKAQETSACADCGIDTLHTLDEWYMVHDDVWEQAWLGRRRYWHGNRVYKGWIEEILCIGCLEARIGRTLCAEDFTDVPINKHTLSERMRERLTATTTRAVKIQPPVKF